MKMTRNKLIKSEKGMILVYALVLLVVVGVLIPPLLGYVSNSVRAQKTKETSSGDLYAADAGVEDALWQIKYNHLYDTFPAYNLYNYTATWSYNLTTPVNDNNVNVTISNVWIPKGILPENQTPTPEDAINIICPPPPQFPRLVVTGNTAAGIGNNIYKYRINLTYYPQALENLTVNTIGVWLPPGFTYYSNSTYKSNLENSTAPYYAAVGKVPQIWDWAGDQNGTATWDYSTPVAFSSFPGVNPSDYPRVTTIDFYYKDEKGKGQQPPAVAWINTSGVSDISYAWDADQKVYRIDSVAGGISVEAYMFQSELRELGAAIGGDYYATGNSLMTDTDSDNIRDHLATPSSATVTESNIPEVADVSAAYLYWSGWKPESSNVPVSPLLPDTCGNFNNWNNGAAWSVYSSSYFQGNYASGPETAKDLTLKDSKIMDLSSYAAGRVAVSWEQWKASPTAQNQTRVPTADGDISGTWNTAPCWDDVDETTPNDADYMTGTLPDAGASYKLFNFSPFTLPAGAPITDLRIYIRAKRLGTSGTANIRTSIKVNGSYYNGTSNNLNSNSFYTYSTTYTTNPNTPGTAWTVDDINGVVGGHPLQQIGVYSNDLNPDALVSMVYVLVNYTRPYDAGDSLNFSLSSNSTPSWSGNIQAFHADDTSIPTSKPSSANFSYIIPSQYLTPYFKIRFYLDGFDAAGMYCYLDDIKLSVMNPDNSVQFSIDGNRTYYNETGYPQQGSYDLIASTSQVLPNNHSDGTPNGFSYSCYRDVTALVQKYSAKSPNPAINHPGHATYTVGGVGVSGDTGNEWSYAGWSLILIYSSTETRGHQLYLFDKFIYSDMDTANGLDVDFDDDGQPGGTITGFIVPAQIGNETNAATITCFVGEGDECYSGDFLAFNTDVSYRTHPLDIPNGDKLWDHTNSTASSAVDAVKTPNSATQPNNVWNCKSLGLSAQGIDVDTFYVPWSSGKLNQGETSARIELFTRTDSWNLVYIILSFRSKKTSGGTISYLITKH